MNEAVSGLIGVILGGLLTASKDIVTFFFQRTEIGRFHAVGIIAVLDAYADKCVSVVSDDGTDQGRPAGRTPDGEEYCEPQVILPDAPDYPPDTDWRSIKFDLMYRAMALQNTARDTNRYIQSCSEHASPPGYDELFNARQEGYARLGLEAVQLASALRKGHRLQEPYKPFWDCGFNITDFFQKKVSEFDKKRVIDEEEYRNFFVSLPSSAQTPGISVEGQAKVRSIKDAAPDG